MKETCNNCDHRHTACWSSCPEYLAAKAKHDEQKQERINQHMANEAINAVQYHGMRRR